PDLGRQLSEEGARAVKERCAPNPDVKVFLADGLSSTALEANAETILGLLLDALKDRGLTWARPSSSVSAGWPWRTRWRSWWGPRWCACSSGSARDWAAPRA